MASEDMSLNEVLDACEFHRVHLEASGASDLLLVIPAESKILQWFVLPLIISDADGMMDAWVKSEVEVHACPAELTSASRDEEDVPG